MEPRTLPKRFNVANPDRRSRRMAPAFYSTEGGLTLRWLSTAPQLRRRGAPVWDPTWPGEAEDDRIRGRAFRWRCDPECGRDHHHTGRTLARLLRTHTGGVVPLGT